MIVLIVKNELTISYYSSITTFCGVLLLFAIVVFSRREKKRKDNKLSHMKKKIVRKF